MNDPKTHFGYRDVAPDEKTRLVGEVFRSVAPKYDLMNDLMSLGVHRLWKRHFVATSGVRPGHQVLDLAGGTGDIAALMAREVGEAGAVVLTDIKPAMLARRARAPDRSRHRRQRALRAGRCRGAAVRRRRFDLVTIAFGLRNVTDKDAALREMRRVLKPGGRALVLEFSRVGPAPLRRSTTSIRSACCRGSAPAVAGDEASYRYLAESIRKHPDQATLEAMMQAAGFERASHRNLSGGIVAIHSGYRV